MQSIRISIPEVRRSQSRTDRVKYKLRFGREIRTGIPVWNNTHRDCAA